MLLADESILHLELRSANDPDMMTSAESDAEPERSLMPWWRDAIAEGRQEGGEEGRDEGREEACRAVLISLLKEKFGRLPKWASNRPRSSSDGPERYSAPARSKADAGADPFTVSAPDAACLRVWNRLQ